MRDKELDGERVQCEGCLGYSDGKFLVLCETCVDKAASYDITKQWLDDFNRAAKKAMKLLESLKDTPLDEWHRIPGEARGTLNAVVTSLADYREKVGQK